MFRGESACPVPVRTKEVAVEPIPRVALLHEWRSVAGPEHETGKRVGAAGAGGRRC